MQTQGSGRLRLLVEELGGSSWDSLTPSSWPLQVGLQHLCVLSPPHAGQQVSVWSWRGPESMQIQTYKPWVFWGSLAISLDFCRPSFLSGVLRECRSLCLGAGQQVHFPPGPWITCVPRNRLSSWVCVALWLVRLS